MSYSKAAEAKYCNSDHENRDELPTGFIASRMTGFIASRIIRDAMNPVGNSS